MVKKNPYQGKHREFENLVKAKGIWFAQAVISSILKIQDIVIYAALVLHLIFLNIQSKHREIFQLDREKTEFVNRIQK